MSHYEDVLSILQSNSYADVVYLDFSKAFDKVDFSVLFRKLKLLGVGGKLGRWLYAFLTDRSFRVSVNGSLSEIIAVLSGVPQGSVLGPLLFLILICDIDKGLRSSHLRSFADDSRVLGAVSCDEDVVSFQSDLDMVYRWASSNKMVFNDTKFEMMRYTNRSISSNSSYNSPSYSTANGCAINQKDQVKDLGITMSNDCTFSEHIQEVIKSMRAKSAWITRTFSCRSKYAMLTLWKSLVIPLHD